MSRGGGKEEIVLSEEKQRDIELYCLRRDIEIYKSFVNHVAKMIVSNNKDWIGKLKEEAETHKQIGSMGYILGLLEKELREK